MPISSFRLKSTIGRNYKTDFDDTLRTKEALRDLDYYEEPSYGMTGYPDEALFSAIEEFQSDQGLQRDGIMKPGGETANAIDEQLLSSTNQNFSNAIKQDPAVIQIAAAPAIARGAIQTLPLLAPFAKKAGEDLKRWWDAPDLAVPEAANSNERTSITDPLPPLPDPIDPPKIDDKTEFPGTPPDIPMIEGRPINEVMKNDPVIFQALRDEIIREFQAAVHVHRRSPLTVEDNTELATDIIPTVLAEWGPEFASTYEHIHGAMDKDGNYKKERYLKNIETGGSKGSSHADLSAKILDQIHDFNTGKMLKDGRGDAWERGSFANLAKNNGNDLVAFFPKRSGMSHAEWREKCMNIAREYFTRKYGPPKK